ncbi:MAG: flavin reductase family protein [Burkholderiales bacterium]|jgi:flavin reductase (DIM6/NTAB) family NADH-FMN oxidoreductase RutF|nr:flavin reductase family protein [Burkholderiales bacterium]
MNTKSISSFDKRDLRNALGSFGTGVTVVTSGNKLSRLVGVTANSFSSVSLEPPIVLWSLVATSPSLDIFDETGRFVINILSLQQMDLSKQFSSNLANKFEGIDFDQGLGGLPVLKDCAATIECKTIQRNVVGDHVLFLGQVENYFYERKPTLLFCQGNYLQGAECETT